jgi:hypothetical protein
VSVRGARILTHGRDLRNTVPWCEVTKFNHLGNVGFGPFEIPSSEVPDLSPILWVLGFKASVHWGPGGPSDKFSVQGGFRHAEAAILRFGVSAGFDSRLMAGVNMKRNAGLLVILGTV